MKPDSHYADRATEMEIEMTDDKKLLELAARAAGIIIGWSNQGVHRPPIAFIDNYQEEWNPLSDDGDEARLECTLGLGVIWYPMCVVVGGHKEWFKDHPDKQTARRRAGVIAAGKAI